MIIARFQRVTFIRAVCGGSGLLRSTLRAGGTTSRNEISSSSLSQISRTSTMSTANEQTSSAACGQVDRMDEQTLKRKVAELPRVRALDEEIVAAHETIRQSVLV